MGVTLTLSGHDPDHSTRLCTNQGFDQVCSWIGTLPAGDYPAAEAFARDMAYQPTRELWRQLYAATLAHTPPGDGTAEMVELLLERLGGGHPDERVAIGFG